MLFLGGSVREGVGRFRCGNGVWECILQMWNGWGIVGGVRGMGVCVDWDGSRACVCCWCGVVVGGNLCL